MRGDCASVSKKPSRRASATEVGGDAGLMRRRELKLVCGVAVIDGDDVGEQEVHWSFFVIDECADVVVVVVVKQIAGWGSWVENVHFWGWCRE